MTSARKEDASRFQQWQRDALSHRPPGAELRTVGPFQVELSTGTDAFTWVTVVDPAVTESDIHASVGRLRSMFARRNKELEIEFDERALPQVGGWLESCGFHLEERNPLMACRPPGFKPFAAAGVTLTQLAATSPPADLQAFQTIRWTEGNLSGRVPPPVERLQQELAMPSSVYLLAWLEREPVGTGVSHTLNGAAEIVGIVTRADRRRRGVAATVSSELVSRHFRSGGDFVFLDAANDEAIRVYERLGFVEFGANAVYR